MTYKEAIDFLFGSLPMYQRQGKAAYKANLDNTLKLDNYFNHPHRSYPTIHVAGTNGKGSVSHMLASVLQQAGYRTGLYTSPHLLDFRERIRINGVPIGEKEVTNFIALHKEIIQEVNPSFFEMTVAMAFDYFARQQVDVALIETGLGGRLDSTNIITPVLSVITNISLDHMEFLGSDLGSIAKEKGGIIKEGIPLVVGQANEKIEGVFLTMASNKRAPVTLAYRSFEPSFHTISKDGSSLMRIRKLEKESPESESRKKESPESGSPESESPESESLENGSLESESLLTIACDLTGDYQQENVITALTAIGQLREQGWDIPEQAVGGGLASVVKNSGIMGRWQTIGENPRSVCDTAHNQAGIAAVVQQLMQVPWKKLHMVWGMVNDKELNAILPMLPGNARYYFTRSSVPRSLDPLSLQHDASAHGLKGDIYPNVEEAYREAQHNAGPNDMIFTGGSTFVVADLLKALGY